MRRTNLSLYYLAGYLVPAGLLLLFVPEFATKLLLSNRTYDYARFHLAGGLLFVICILIVQIIRYHLEQLYTATLVARALSSPTDRPHYRNFLDCVRSRKRPNADVEEGHKSTRLCHLGNIAYRLGRTVHFDATSEGIPDDAEAAKLLGREYRKGYEMPQKV